MAQVSSFNRLAKRYFVKTMCLFKLRLADKGFLIFFFFAFSQAAEALFEPLQNPAENSVVGELSYTYAEENETLLDIARRYGLGYEEIVQANSTLDRWIPGKGARVALPLRFILPDAPREGIIIDISELRLYYFPNTSSVNDIQPVFTYPISAGRLDWPTPVITTHIVDKKKNPSWYPPSSLRLEAAAEGKELPRMIPGGAPDNPLGHYALRLGVPGYLIHGTDYRKQYGIGMAVTHGCIRMYPENIEELYRLVSIGTSVRIVYQPIKFGWQGSILYVEVQAPSDQYSSETYLAAVNNEEAAKRLSEETANVATPDFAALLRAIDVANGVPVAVARTPSGLPPILRKRLDDTNSPTKNIPLNFFFSLLDRLAV